MIRLTQNQIQQKIDFISQYLQASNAATASQVDANANVTSKNIATMEAEINKDINIQINRELVRRKIEELFGEELSREYIRQIEAHEIYVHDETSLKPYCFYQYVSLPFRWTHEAWRGESCTKALGKLLWRVRQFGFCHQLAICWSLGYGRISLIL